MNRPSQGIVAVVLALVVGTAVAACGGNDGSSNLPAGYVFVPQTQSIWGDNGVEAYCELGNRVYSNVQGGVAVVPNDPHCK